MFGFESWSHTLLVFVAALAAGAANAVAGGGSAISFPALVLVGVPPVAANATNALGLWPGSIAAAWSYRARLRSVTGRTRWLLAPALVGGLVGAWLLVQLPARWFAGIAPFLVLGAAVSVGVEPMAKRWLGTGRIRESGASLWGGLAAVLGVALYGGYFGAGMGIMLLTAFGLMGLRDLQHANGLKNLITVTIKLPAIAYFVVIGLPEWNAVVTMAVGAITGGWIAGHLIQKVDAERLRWVVVVVGAALGAFMLFR